MSEHVGTCVPLQSKARDGGKGKTKVLLFQMKLPFPRRAECGCPTKGQISSEKNQSNFKEF